MTTPGGPYSHRPVQQPDGSHTCRVCGAVVELGATGGCPHATQARALATKAALLEEENRRLYALLRTSNTVGGHVWARMVGSAQLLCLGCGTASWDPRLVEVPCTVMRALLQQAAQKAGIRA